MAIFCNIKSQMGFKFGLAVLAVTCVASVSCKRQTSGAQENTDGSNFKEVTMSLSPEYYDSVINVVGRPNLVILKEDDKTMYSDISRIISKNKMFYILDSFGSRTVVSFTKEGEPVARYGKVGTGPGEYVRPWDVDVDESYVYILDSNLKKIMRFDQSGSFIDEKKIPFIADGFKLLENGRVLFSLLPDGSGEERLCVTDSSMNVVSKQLSSRKGYVGGWRTNNVFRAANNMIQYYKAPLDTLFTVDGSGIPKGGLVFNFGSRRVPNEAMLDFIEGSSKDDFNGSLMLADNPIDVGNGYMVGIVMEEGTQYVVIFDKDHNRCGARKCDGDLSVYDILEPCGVDEDSNLICYTSIEYAEDLKNYQEIPDDIKAGLEENNRMLLLYPFSRLK